MKIDQKLNILFVEDLPADVELAQRELRKEQLEFTSHVVDTEKAFRTALDELEPDIVISDYSMPTFDGMSALRITRERSKHIPFIVLTGSINEETAVNCMKAGANDYVLKEQIKRLPFSVLEVIQRNQERIDKETMENKLRKSEARFKTIMASMQDMVFTLDREQRHTGVYGPWVEQQGFVPDDFLGKTAREIMGKDTARIHEKANEQALKGDFVIYEWSAPAKSGTVNYQTSLSPIFNEKGKVEGLVGVGRNITELKQAEENLKVSENRFRELVNTINSGVAIYKVINDGNSGEDYIIQDFNKTALKMEKMKKNEVVGKSLKYIRPNIDEYGLIPIFKKVWKTGERPRSTRMTSMPIIMKTVCFVCPIMRSLPSTMM